jgi:t-SNARE complex subunit (syntaxin)
MSNLTQDEQEEINRELKSRAIHLRRIRKSRTKNLVACGLCLVVILAVMGFRFQLFRLGITQSGVMILMVLPLFAVLAYCAWNYFRS